MKKFTCCFILLLCSFYTHAQSSQKLDSLKKVLAKLPKEGASFAGDTTRVRVLCEMGKLLWVSEPDTSYNLTKKAIVLSEKTKNERSLALAYHQHGYSSLVIGKNLEGVEYFFKSLHFSEKLKADSLIGVNNRQIGNAYFELKKFELAEFYYKKAMHYFLKINYQKGYANCLNDIGRSYFLRNKYNEAIVYFNNGIAYAEKVHLPIIKNYCTWSIANSYLEEKKFDLALKYAKVGLTLNKEMKDIIAYDWIMGYNTMSRIFLGEKNYDEALRYAKISENGFENKSENNLIPIYKTNYEIYSATHNTQQALYYFEKYTKLNDAAKQQDFSKQLDNITFEYENLKQKDQILLLNEKDVRSSLIRKILIAGLIIVVFVGGVFWRNNVILTTKNNQIENQKKEIVAINSQLEDLNQNLENKVNTRTQELKIANKALIQKNEEILTALVEGQTLERKRVAIELHDNLGAMLSSMKWRLEVLDKQKLTEKEQKIYDGILSMMGDAYAEIRLISHNLLPAELEKSGLQGALKKLANDINLSEKVALSLDIDEKSIPKDKKTQLELYGIAMELVNNILKHSKATVANLAMYSTKNKTIFEIQDNGIGIKTDITQNGVGLKNLDNRVKAINGNLEIISDAMKGTKIKITFSQNQLHLN